MKKKKKIKKNINKNLKKLNPTKKVYKSRTKLPKLLQP